MNRQKRTLIFRIAGCMLCLFLIVSAVDAIPDPPALVQHLQHSLICQVRQSVTTPADSTSVFVVSVPFFETVEFSTNGLRETEYPSFELTFVSEATDTSPPVNLS